MTPSRTSTVAAAGSFLAFTVGGPVLLARAGVSIPLAVASFAPFFLAWVLAGAAAVSLFRRCRKRQQDADTTTYEQPGRAA